MLGLPGSEAWFVLLACHPPKWWGSGVGGDGPQLWEPGLLKQHPQPAILLLEQFCIYGPSFLLSLFPGTQLPVDASFIVSPHKHLPRSEDFPN